MNYGSFIISFLIGWLILTTFKHERHKMSLGLKTFLSVGMGLGTSAILSFYAILLGNGHNAPVVIGMNALLVLLLLALNRKCWQSSGKDFSVKIKLLWESLRPVNVGIVALFIIMAGVTATLAKNHYYGEWDAIAFWNMKAQFLFHSHEHWKNMFALDYNTNTDYPLLLPLINVWGWTLTATDTDLIPYIVSIVFTVSCSGLLYAGLKDHISQTIALLAACLLLFLPPWILLGTSQYADVILAYYLLAGVIMLLKTIQFQSKGYALITGLLWGMMCFTKHEGLISTGTLAIFSSMYLLFPGKKFQKKNFKIIVNFLPGLFIALIPTLIVKMLSVHHGYFIDTKKWDSLGSMVSPERLSQVMQAFLASITDAGYVVIWPMFFLIIVMQPKRYFFHESKIISGYIVTYAGIVFCVYLFSTSADLSFFLRTSLPRVLLTQVPTLIFLHFYVYWRKGVNAQ